jgi:RNA polymerase sigma-70 factor (ECF subfamily)
MELSQNQWSTWFDRHARPLVLFAQQIVHTRAAAEDAVQDGFVRFWKHRHQAADPVAYLYSCVKHAAMDLLRGEGRRRIREATVSPERSGEQLTSHIESEEQRIEVEAALRALPDAQRQVLVMRIWGELTFVQIAKALDIPTNTAASRYRYALKNLRDQLREEIVP